LAGNVRTVILCGSTLVLWKTTLSRVECDVAQFDRSEEVETYLDDVTTRRRDKKGHQDTQETME
jgi:hypothetical protein